MSAASRTPFEATHRVFVLERADTMNDEAANSLLKTLEEPPPYVVLLLLTDRLTQVLPTITSRCQPVRFDPLPAAALAQRLQSRGVAPDAAARLRAARRSATASGPSRWRSATGPALRARAEAFARAPLRGRAARRAAVAARCSTCPRAGAAGRGAGRGGARRGARVPAQEGAQAARDRVHRACPARRAAGHDRRARPRAPARRPLVPRLGLRRRRRARARPPHRPRPELCARTPTGATHGALRAAVDARRRHPRAARAQRRRGAGAARRSPTGSSG